MKRSLAITATTTLLALSLAGCGAERNGDVDLLPDFDGTNGEYGTTATDTMQNGAGSMNGTGTSAGADTNGGLNNVTGAVNRGTSRYGSARYGMSSRAYAGRNATYSAGTDTYMATNNGGMTGDTRYALMLENARVHDSDGFLLDGENAHYNTF